MLLSYAHEAPAHVATTEIFCRFLRSNGVDARLDLFAAEERQDWVLWTVQELRLAERVLLLVSPEYRRRFEATGPIDEGRGVQLEGRLIREEIYHDQAAALSKFLPVLLPGASIDDIPQLLGPHSGTHYRVRDMTVAGAEPLMRLLTRQPSNVLPDLGPPPVLPAVAAELVVVLRVIVSGGTAAVRDEVLRIGLRAAVDGGATVESGAAGPDIAGLVVASTDDMRWFGGVVRALRERVEAAGSEVHVRIGADLELRSADHIARVADRLANCRAVDRMQVAHCAPVVVAASASFHTQMAQSRSSYPAASAYSQFAEDQPDGPTCWIALPPRASCPDLPSASVPDQTERAPGDGRSGPGHTFSGNRDVTIVDQRGDHNSFHKGNVIHRNGPA